MIISTLEEFYGLLISNRPLISIDYGKKKLGIAISDKTRNISMPIRTIYVTDDSLKIVEILSIMNKYLVCGIVIGLPLSMDGSRGVQVEIVKKFTDLLSASTELPIFMQDERLTSKAADKFLQSFGLNRKKRSKCDDSVAASMILESVLSSVSKISCV